MLPSLVLLALGPVKPQSFGEAWRAAGLDRDRTSIRRAALPARLFEQVQTDALAIARDAKRPREWKDKFGKLPTNWLAVRAGGGWHAPRSAIEAAVHHLHALVFGGEPAAWVAGAEWWVQQQGAISFHYDKDEAMASEQMTMAYPEVSTVTYLSPHGAPTMVLDQVTPDGNGNTPELPRRAWLSPPENNKHLAFRGNLQHGVRTGLMAAPAGAAGERMTLLINWWRDAPLPPNCAPLDAASLRLLGQLRSAAELEPLLLREAPPAELGAWRPLAPPPSGGVRHSLELPPTDIIYFELPAALERADWRVEWPREQVLGPVTRLDLQHTGSVSGLFRERRPKLVLVLADRGEGGDWLAALPKWLRAFHQKFERAFRFVLADPQKTADFMRTVGLTAADAPTVVIHDTHASVVRRLEKPMTSAAVWRLAEEWQRRGKDEV